MPWKNSVKQFEDKLCNLLSFLTQLPSELEIIADEIDNENLKNALTAVAVESDQYAKELSAHVVQPGHQNASCATRKFSTGHYPGQPLRCSHEG
jgi:hypothetical protein